MSDALISYPFKLPNRQYLCRLNLPPDLTIEEARRLSSYIRALVMPHDEATESCPRCDSPLRDHGWGSRGCSEADHDPWHDARKSPDADSAGSPGEAGGVGSVPCQRKRMRRC